MLYILPQVSFTLFKIVVNDGSLLSDFLILEKAFRY